VTQTAADLLETLQQDLLAHDEGRCLRYEF
jgi:hypothetical protein